MKKLFFIILIILILGMIAIVVATSFSENAEFIVGKNNVTLEETFKPIYVKDFMKKYPEIKAISYNENGVTGGYINYFQGIGENFILKPTKQYEIITSKNISISLG